MLLILTHALVPQRTIRTLPTPFKTIGHLAGLLLRQPAALSALLSCRTNGSLFFNDDLKNLGAKRLVPRRRRRLRRPHQSASFLFRLDNFLGRNIGSIHILHFRSLSHHL